MPVYKQPNSKNWLIEFKVDGKRYRRSSGTNIKRTATRIEEKWRQEIHDGKYQIGTIKTLTIEEAADRYFNSVIQPKNNRTNSKKAERYSLNVIVRNFSPNTRLDTIQSEDIARWRDQMLLQGYAPATANRYMASLRAIMNRACAEWNALKVVPQFHLLPLDNNRCRYLSVQEEAAIFENAPPHLKNLIVFLVDTGARLSEALDLTWDHVDLGNTSHTSITLTKTKNGQPRRIPLTARTTNLLMRLRANNLYENRSVFLYHPPGDKTPVPFKSPFTAWKTALRNAEVDQSLRIHDLRHTFASRLVSKGVPIFDVSKLLGHKSIAMTMRYAHLSSHAFNDAIIKLDNYSLPEETSFSADIIDIKVKPSVPRTN
jgi:integrase